MGKDDKSTLDKLLGLAKKKGKSHYRLFFIEHGKERLVEEKEIDGDEDMETRVHFEDYRMGSTDKKFPHQNRGK